MCIIAFEIEMLNATRGNGWVCFQMHSAAAHRVPSEED